MSKQPWVDPDRALMSSVVDAMRQLQSATHQVDRSAAQHLGVNSTDLALLGHLESGPRAPKELAGLVHITPASTTVAMNRLAAAGWIHREANPVDARAQVVTLTGAGRAALEEIYGPIRDAGGRLLAGMTRQELTIVLRFLQESTDLQLDQAAAVRSLSARAVPHAEESGN